MPDSSNNEARPTLYAVNTQANVVRGVPVKSLAMLGSATATIVVSSATMNELIDVMASVFHARRLMGDGV